jgi:hypothetical protein
VKYIRGMKDPADGVVDELGLGVGLVTTLMSKDPNTGGDEASPKGIQRPERELGSSVENRVWELDDFRMDLGIEKRGSLVDSSQGSKIRDAERIYALGFTC